MSDFAYDDSDDLDLKPAVVLAEIRRLGLDFISTSITELGSSSYNNRDARDIKEARHAAKSWLCKSKYNPLTIWRIFEAVYKDELRVNSWTDETFLGSTPATIGKMLNRLEDVLETALGLPPAFLARRLDALVEGRKFSPVQRYLQELPKLTPDDWADWGKLAEILFGTSDHGSQVKLSRWLIGAVARAMKPGCKMDSALVIRGKQGIGKTSMLQALFGEHFRTLHSSQSQLEQQRNIQGCWGAELGELEATFRAKDISALKAFLTETHDSFRDLQKELKAPRPRHCVLAGTTNETAFLNDSTGSRRFWVIDAGSHNIPVKWVKENRDRIWAVAYSFYLAGEQHWLTAAEAELSELGNKNYETENPFVEPLKTAFDILEAKGMPIAIKASDISQYFLGISPANQKRYSKEVAAALESLGFVKKEFKSQKLSGRFYVRPDATEYVPFNLAMVDHIRSARAYQGRECIQSI